MRDIVEIVAKALASDLEEGFPRFTQMRWDQLTVPAKAAYRRRARAAIEAMKLVSADEGVIGGVAFEDGFFGEQKTIFHAFVDGWNLTIDQILYEVPK